MFKGGVILKDRIKKIRKDKKLSMEKFGDRIGLKKNSVSQIESGVNNPSEAVIISICREFRVNESWLRTGEGEPYIKRTRNQEIMDFANDVMEEVDASFKKRFVIALSKLDESDWNTIKKIADELIKED